MQKLLLARMRDIPENGSILVKGPDDQDIALFKENGQVYALDNRCPHMDGPLNEGEIVDGVVTCPWHGWQFRLCSGECLNMPGIDASTLQIAVEDDAVYLVED